MPTSQRCRRVLEQPITPAVCSNFRQVRRRVLCDAWQRVRDEGIPFREAVRRAWDKALDECRGGG